MQPPLTIPAKRFDPTLPFPSRQSAGAACYDLYAREDSTIPPGEVGYIPLNIAIDLPSGHWALLAARSSTHKLGLLPANGIGIIDEDFRGNNDEYRLAVLNFRNDPVTVTRGSRIAQIMVLPVTAISLEEVDLLDNPDRGGFGSTGTT